MFFKENIHFKVTVQFMQQYLLSRQFVLRKEDRTEDIGVHSLEETGKMLEVDLFFEGRGRKRSGVD